LRFARARFDVTPSCQRSPVLNEQRATILQIIPKLDTGGAELSTIEIASAIVRAGGRALVLSEGGQLAAKVETAGGELIAFPAATKNPLRILSNAFRLARIIERESVDLVHARSRAPAWSALIAARLTKRPFVTTYHGAYNEGGPFKRTYNSVMVRGEAVIANSHYTQDLIRARYGTAQSKIRVIHRGVDEKDFKPENVGSDRIQALREKWALAPDDLVVLQAARLTGWKGQRVMIEATALLERQGRLGHAVIVLAGSAQGRDGYKTELEQLIGSHGLEGRVRLVGHVDDMPAALLLARLAVVASTEPEAFGRTVTEAQAMGCPVVATDHGAPPETILAPPGASAGERTGWLVPPGDAAGLAEAIAEGLAQGHDARADMGRRARSHVLRSFSIETMQRKTLAVYDQLLGTSLANPLEVQSDARDLPAPRSG
jgi:glycosyltransferase involved in cell wall biosynthesis